MNISFRYYKHNPEMTSTDKCPLRNAAMLEHHIVRKEIIEREKKLSHVASDDMTSLISLKQLSLHKYPRNFTLP
ncbi:Hypothetical predicted protein [Octopus vulgaris]|uniref:Uncharacterized protein n=1 Tax=Octopus vulgaris TaxID=6645 RepID=A0AA36BJB5_OCTVU|nr:Hypothetical predicted protein [Octopus vulgaris]